MTRPGGGASHGSGGVPPVPQPSDVRLDRLESGFRQAARVSGRAQELLGGGLEVGQESGWTPWSTGSSTPVVAASGPAVPPSGC